MRKKKIHLRWSSSMENVDICSAQSGCSVPSQYPSLRTGRIINDPSLVYCQYEYFLTRHSLYFGVSGLAFEDKRQSVFRTIRIIICGLDRTQSTLARKAPGVRGVLQNIRADSLSWSINNSW